MELWESNFESSFAGVDNEQAVDNFNFLTDDLSTTCMFRDKKDSGRGITTRKFSRGMKQEYQKTQRGQLHVFMDYASLG